MRRPKARRPCAYRYLNRIVTMTWSGLPQQIAGKSIHRYRLTWPHGRTPAGSIGGSKKRQQWLGGYAVQTGGNCGSKLVIFVLW